MSRYVIEKNGTLFWIKDTYNGEVQAIFKKEWAHAEDAVYRYLAVLENKDELGRIRFKLQELATLLDIRAGTSLEDVVTVAIHRLGTTTRESR